MLLSLTPAAWLLRLAAADYIIFGAYHFRIFAAFAPRLLAFRTA